MVLAIVEELRYIRCVVALEVLTVEVADEVLRCRTTKETTWINIDYHDPLLLSVDGHREEVGALKLVRLGSVSLSEGTDVGPVLEIMRLIEAHFLISRDNHEPTLLRSIPEDFGVAEVKKTVERCKDGVILILCEGHPIVR